ncbi:MAG: hypothetical protein AABX04_07955 [Nanoarchaeota archaeon]
MKKMWCGMFFLVLLVGSVQSSNLLLNFNSPEKIDFSDYILTLKVNNEIKTDKLLSSGYSLDLLNGNYTLTVMLDSSATPALDYIGSRSVIVTGSDTVEVFVLPVGHVQGSVTDTEGNLASGARVSVNCFSGNGGTYLEEADQTGFFSFSNLPEGGCILIASDTKNAAKQEMVIERGEVTAIEVSLKQKLVQKSSWWEYLIYSLMIILGIFLLGRTIVSLIQKKEVSKKNSSLEVSIKEKKLSSHTLVILPTLSDKERLVVNFLLQQNNTSPQAKVRHGTHLPRTTLSRVLEGLERKKILVVNKDGKAIVLTLTPFFLGTSEK